jgi:hypothetical protein
VLTAEAMSRFAAARPGSPAVTVARGICAYSRLDQIRHDIAKSPGSMGSVSKRSSAFSPSLIVLVPQVCQGITAYLEADGMLENAQAMTAQESPRTTKLYEPTADAITLNGVERRPAPSNSRTDQGVGLDPQNSRQGGLALFGQMGSAPVGLPIEFPREALCSAPDRAATDPCLSLPSSRHGRSELLNR